ncbi:MAG: 50S ribosomal protein L29 [SAR324 cluster bacterium]|nr:50S ribosomal protein L29 [SAR324 cluster bacterium]MCH8885046.1 50S ribosomal protein L29 [SAR324 cluster bacterium]
MNTNEMRQFSSEELEARLAEWEEDLFKDRCSQVLGQVTDTTSIRLKRRHIARAKTIINEMRRDAASQG